MFVRRCEGAIFVGSLHILCQQSRDKRVREDDSIVPHSSPNNHGLSDKVSFQRQKQDTATWQYCDTTVYCCLVLMISQSPIFFLFVGNSRYLSYGHCLHCLFNRSLLVFCFTRRIELQCSFLRTSSYVVEEQYLKLCRRTEKCEQNNTPPKDMDTPREGLSPT